MSATFSLESFIEGNFSFFSSGCFLIGDTFFGIGGRTSIVPGTLPFEDAHMQYQGLAVGGCTSTAHCQGLAVGECTSTVPGTLPLEDALPQHQGLCCWRMHICSTRDFAVGGCASAVPGTPELFLTNTTLTFLVIASVFTVS